MLRRPGLSLLALSLLSALARADGPPLSLRLDTSFRGSRLGNEGGSVYLRADRLESREKEVIEAYGHVEARHAGQNFFADYARYNRALNQLVAQGGVRLEQASVVVTGSFLQMQLNTRVGHLDHPVFYILTNHSRGEATKADFLGQERYRLEKVRYTTCPVGNDDWLLKAGTLNINQQTQLGTASNVLLTFKSVPLLYSPWLDFPIGGQRKSGFLAPVFGTTSQGGIDISLPYYLNLAPNYDLTLYPRVITKRGLQMGFDGRYLFPAMNGEDVVEYLPNDRVAGRDRWGLFLSHNQSFGVPGLSASVNYQRVSDNNYFRDLSNQVVNTSTTILPQQGSVSYDAGWWQASFLAQQFQTLQDPNAPVAVPYNRMPELDLTAAKYLTPWMVGSVDSQFVKFAGVTSAPTGTRFVLYPRIALPYETSYFHFTPKLGVNYARYDLSNNVVNGVTADQITRTLPIASLDTGLAFERNFSFRGQPYAQTLEPRLFYVYIPYRDQNAIPVFDTGQLDFNFAQMFQENQFVGWDRINNANQLTVAASSRFIEQSTGLERLNVALGQRFYFTPQRVTLPNVPLSTQPSSDFLAVASGQITRTIRVGGGWEYNVHANATVKSSLSFSYQPYLGEVVNLGYNFIAGSIEQVDFSTQWPLTSRLYGLVRLNYSTRDRRLLDALAGVEYNGGCWVLRAVMQRIPVSQTKVNNAFFIQLQLNGLFRLGSDPLSALQQSIQGYASTNQILDRP